MKELKEMKSKELREIAKELKVKNWWKLSNAILIEEIEKIQNASEEEKTAADEERAKEDAAIAEYTSNWSKYTKKFDIGEFLEKWKAGKIVLESEKAAVETVREEMTKQGIKPEEKPEEKPVPVIKPKEEKPEEKIEPFVYTDAEGETWEDYDIGEKMMRWSEEKRLAFDTWFEKEWIAMDLDCLDQNIDSWSKQWDKSHNIEPNEKVGHPAPKRGALIEWNGKAQNICAWGEELGISPNTLYGRLYKLGWSVEKAFTKK